MTLTENRSDEKSESPLVTFLIVAFNARPFLSVCIGSVFGQSYRRIEAVLVDNASTDGGVEEIRAEFAGNNLVRIVHSDTNLGPSAGAMLGLPHCRGEFIARIDADDVAVCDRIQRQVNYLRLHPEKMAVGGDVLRITAAGKPLGAGLSLRGEFMRRHAAKWYIGCFHTSLLIRKSAIADRGYNPTLFAAQDHELIEWFAERGQVGVVPYIVTLYRHHDSSITRSQQKLLRLTGSEVRYLFSELIGAPLRRNEVKTRDFSYLFSDERLELSVAELGRWFEEKCIARKNWLGAAYFASINRRWVRFWRWVARAVSSPTAWRETLSLVLCRTFWPLRLRQASAEVIIFQQLIPPHAGLPLERSLRLAWLLNKVRVAARLGGTAGAVLLVCYFGLKPSPSVRDVSLLPRSAVHFLDHHNFLCNVVAFFALTSVVQVSLGGITDDSAQACWRRSIVIATLAAGIEIVQIYLPQRVFDPMDIATGWLGILMATWIFLPEREKKHSKTRGQSAETAKTLAN